MKKGLFLFLLFLSCTCYGQKTSLIKGDLYFGLWRYGSLYNQPKKMVRSVLKYMDTVDRSKCGIDDSILIHRYDLLKEKELLYSPYVQIIQDDDAVIYLYLKQEDYDQIKTFKREDLVNRTKRVSISAEYELIDKGFVLCTKLTSVDELEGKTLPRQSKFALEDYD